MAYKETKYGHKLFCINSNGRIVKTSFGSHPNDLSDTTGVNLPEKTL